VGKVSATEVKSFLMQALPDFYSYLAVIARNALAGCAEEGAFADFIKNDKFVINVGDYMTKTETVHAKNRFKDADELTKWFCKRLCGKYNFGDYTCLDFSDKAFPCTDIRFAQFCGSVLKGTDFGGSTLIGCNFRNAIMEGCRMDKCSLSEADFTGAVIRDASLRKARAKSGLTDKREWKFAGYLPVCFRNSDLTNTDFTGAILIGADFTGANLSGANFNGALLDSAIFAGAQLDGADFSGALLAGAVLDCSKKVG